MGKTSGWWATEAIHMHTHTYVRFLTSNNIDFTLIVS